MKLMFLKGSVSLNRRQLEELAKLFLDMGKLVFASLVLGLFQTRLEPAMLLGVGLFGLTIAFVLFILGLELLKGVK